MTAHSPESPEGSILTPKGWVTGKVQFDGHAISAVDGRTTSAAAKPKAPFVLPGFIDLHVHGTIVGALILTVLNSILTLLDVPESARQKLGREV